MKIAITAASGNLGAAIISELVKQLGKELVIGLARTPDKATHLGIEIRKGDYNNKSDFEKALQGVDKLLIVSGMDSPEKRIQQHRNIIDAAKHNTVGKLVYTSIIGDKEQTAFSPIIQSNRQTEEDIKQSGLNWVIGRNGLYIEPDLEYIDQYKKAGSISNSAGNGLCAYTSREELAVAYSRMLLEEKHNGQIYNLVGNPITQNQLVELINEVYGTKLRYQIMSVEDFINERKLELGEFLGTIIGGIYEGIRNGAFNISSDFEKAAGRPHKTTIDIISDFKTKYKK